MRRLAVLLIGLALVLTGCGATRDTAPDRAGLSATTTTWVAAAGDIACPPGHAPSGNRCRQAATARLVTDVKRPSYVFALGDTQYEEGTYRQHLNSYAKSWGRFLGKTFPVVGNHEYRTPGAAGYFRYFAGRTTPSPGYYRRPINGWWIYFLNTNCGRVNCAAQRTWLRNSLAADRSRCAMILMHHPRYSSGAHGNQAVAKQFWSIALSYGVDVALAGHDHNYERFARMDNEGHGSGTGIVSYVVGTGGKNLYPMGVRKPGSLRFWNSRHGLLYLGLRPGGWSWEFRTIYNVVRDSGSATCT